MKLIHSLDKTDALRQSVDRPYASLFHDMLAQAKALSASDIHIQPAKGGLDIRFRVHGDMNTWKSLGAEHRQSFIIEAKRLSGLSIAISGRAQDARVSIDPLKMDLRSSLLPSQFGEKIVLRLLDQEREFHLEAILKDSGTLRVLRDGLSSSHGLLILSGPTGSGKTTTLYGMLSDLDRGTLNILTLEDPIEYCLPGLTQVQIGPKLSFAQALRSVLRQDPDVILVGEIRDEETAELCMKAAGTGHLVLSTLHANGALEAIQRMRNLGIDDLSLNASLKLSAAQRLVQTLCPDCSLKLDRDELDALRENGLIQVPLTGFRKRSIQGCTHCHAGVTGRAPILSAISGAQIQKAVMHKAGDELQETDSLRSVAMRLAKKGEVDVYEAIRMD